MDKETQMDKDISDDDYVIYYLVRSHDFKQVMLTIDSTRAVNPEEFLQALQCFIDDIHPDRVKNVFEDYEEYPGDPQ